MMPGHPDYASDASGVFVSLQGTDSDLRGPQDRRPAQIDRHRE
jgi:hypothetical protein